MDSRSVKVLNENNFDCLIEMPCSLHALSEQGNALNTHNAFKGRLLFCFVYYIFVFSFFLLPQIEALIKCYEGRRLYFALFFIIPWIRE